MMAKVEIPRHTVPGYLTDRLLSEWPNLSPGHRFLIYFPGIAYKVTLSGERREVKNKAKFIEEMLGKGEWAELYKKYNPSGWEPLKESKIYALKAVGPKSGIAEKLAESLRRRQTEWAARLSNQVSSITLKLESPLTTGLGNPHPVENGFSFLSPYGIPYLPGSSIKGVVRRAAEELALFDKESDWTIPLVWLLFGFEGTSIYIAPPSKLESIDVIGEEAERWRSAFRQYAEQKANGDEALKYWLKKVRSSIPEDQQELANKPEEFCRSLQNKNNENMRKSLSWQGFIRFWDAFFTENSLEVDILSPHHKDYYEKGGYDPKATPNDAELPIPAFFLTIPSGTEFTLHCQFMPKGEEDTPFLSNWRSLIADAIEYACHWLGFGAKTSVGYGAGDLDKKGVIQDPAEIETKVKKELETTNSSNILGNFENIVSQTQNLPGEIDSLIHQVKGQRNEHIKKEMSLILLKKAKSLRGKKKFTKALRDNKSWAVRLKELLIENGIPVEGD
jgi:CRISPR type III-B/RAMP module RAMP protein Cmr6